VVLNFWASWCDPCKREAPILEAAWRASRDKGAVVLGLDVQDLSGEAHGFIAEHGQTYPQVRDKDDGTYRAYGSPECRRPSSLTVPAASASTGLGRSTPSRSRASRHRREQRRVVSDLGATAFAVAFTGGVASFLSPCVLALVPGLPRLRLGVSVEALAQKRRAVVSPTLAFIGGFALVFTLLGAGIGGTSAILKYERRSLEIAGGALLVALGLIVVLGPR
jgi:thiol:disulfide interchange protein